MAAPARQGTMQQTLEEGREYLKSEGADHLLPDVQDEDDGDHPPAPGRQGTMQVTAAEGIEYLKAAGEEKLLEIQGLLPTNGNGAAKRKHDDDENGDEDEDFVDGDDDDEDEVTNGNGAPHLAKHGTMHATAKEGEELLEWMGGAPDPSAKTRAQQRELDSERDEPDAKKPKVARDTTIQQTTKEANALLDNEVLGESRSQTTAMKDAEDDFDDEEGDEEVDDEEDDEDDDDDVPTPKKTHTMKAATEESRHIVPEPEEVGGTRSATAALEQAEKESKKRGNK